MPCLPCHAPCTVLVACTRHTLATPVLPGGFLLGCCGCGCGGCDARWCGAQGCACIACMPSPRGEGSRVAVLQPTWRWRMPAPPRLPFPLSSPLARDGCVLHTLASPVVHPPSNPSAAQQCEGLAGWVAGGRAAVTPCTGWALGNRQILATRRNHTNQTNLCSLCRGAGCCGGRNGRRRRRLQQQRRSSQPA